MYPVIYILGREIGSYAIFSMVGFAASIALLSVILKQDGLKFEDIIIYFLSVAAGIFVGGHLLFGIVNISDFIQKAVAIKNIGEFFSVITSTFGGMVFYGGFIGGAIALKIYASGCKEKPEFQVFDVFAFIVPFFHIFGRIGCFFAGCCYGIESSFGFTVTENILVPDICGIKRLPVALFEAAFNFTVFIMIFLLYKNCKMRGKLIYLYLIVYPIGRFLLEFLRGDSARGIWLGLSTSQWISILLIIFSVCMLLKTRKPISKIKRGI